MKPSKQDIEKNSRRGWLGGLCLLMLLGSLTISCTDSITQLLEARRVAADLHVKFNKAADASNRAVMADTDDVSSVYAREASQAKQAVKSDMEALAPVLRDLRFDAGIHLLDEFGRHFAEYQALDRRILELAVENTNLKAQRLAFGAAREAVDAFRKSLDAITLAASPKNRSRVEVLAASAIIAVREIQVLQAPHIAESKDEPMARMEKEMEGLESSARAALTTLSSLIEPAPRAQLDEALAALDRFKGINTQIIALSRRNSNVHSLAMALGPGRTLTAACEANLSALVDGLAKEGFKATR